MVSRSTFQSPEEGLLTGRDQRLVATANTLRSSRTPCVFIPNASRPVVHVGGALQALNFLPHSASYIFLRFSSEIACPQNPACGSARAYGHLVGHSPSPCSARSTAPRPTTKSPNPSTSHTRPPASCSGTNAAATASRSRAADGQPMCE